METLLFVLVSIAYVVISVNLLSPRFIVNDNIINQNFIIGGYQIDYVGVFLTELLHGAYMAQPIIPWYPLSLYTLHIVSVCVWLTLISRAFRPWWLALVFSVVFLAFYLFFLINLDYTSTSEMLCISSLAYACLDVLERRPGHLRYLGAGMIFTLGMWVRPQGVLGAFACVLPVALMVASQRLRQNPTSQEMRKLVLVVLVFMAPAILNLAADTAYRRYTLTPQQASYDAFNRPRGVLHGLSPERQTEIILDRHLVNQAQFSVPAAEDLFHWRYLDERVDTAAAMQALATHAPPPQHPFADMVGHMEETFRDETALMYLLFCSLPLFLLALRRHPWLAGLGFLLPFYCVMLDALLSAFLTFRDRTELPFVASFAFLSLVLSGYLATHEAAWKGGRRAACMLIAVMIALYGARSAVRFTVWEHKSVARQAAFTREQLKVLNRDYAGSYILLMPITGLQLESLNPLAYKPLYFHAIDMVWDTFSPYFYAEISPLGIKHGYELVDALIDNKNAYYIGDDRGAYTMLNIYGDKSKGELERVRIRDFSGGYDRQIGLYRFVTVKQTDKKTGKKNR